MFPYTICLVYSFQMSFKFQYTGPIYTVFKKEKSLVQRSMINIITLTIFFQKLCRHEHFRLFYLHIERIFITFIHHIHYILFVFQSKPFCFTCKCLSNIHKCYLGSRKTVHRLYLIVKRRPYLLRAKKGRKLRLCPKGYFMN